MLEEFYAYESLILAFAQYVDALSKSII